MLDCFEDEVGCWADAVVEREAGYAFGKLGGVCGGRGDDTWGAGGAGGSYTYCVGGFGKRAGYVCGVDVVVFEQGR
jgi:hypothetical protein